MDIEFWQGLIAVIGRGLVLVLAPFILYTQVKEIKQHRSIGAFRWTLFGLQVALVFTALSPLWVGIERLLTGSTSDLMLLLSTLSVNVFILGMQIGFVLMYFVFNRREK